MSLCCSAAVRDAGFQPAAAGGPPSAATRAESRFPTPAAGLDRVDAAGRSMVSLKVGGTTSTWMVPEMGTAPVGGAANWAASRSPPSTTAAAAAAAAAEDAATEAADGARVSLTAARDGDDTTVVLTVLVAGSTLALMSCASFRFRMGSLLGPHGKFSATLSPT
jgi:hypothetical protein